MLKPKYTIQQLDIKNYALLVPLMKNCFNMTVHENYFKWKYFDNPLGNCIGYLAIETNTNEAVSFYGAIPQSFLIDGKQQTIYQACDTMTHTQHRKKSFYTILAKECYEKLKSLNNFFLIGIGGTNESFPVLQHFGWKQVFLCVNYFKPSIFCLFQYLQKYDNNNFVKDDTLENIEHLFLNKNKPSEIQSIKTLQQYKWRISNPNYQYKIVSYKTNDIIIGYIIYHVNNNKIFLFDFLFENKLAKKSLLWYLAKLVVQNKYKGIVTLCQQNGHQSYQLKKNLFITNPFNKGPLAYKPPFLLFSDEQTMAKYSIAKKWQVSAYDYDAI